MSSELVAVVAAIKADGKRTSPDDVLAQVHATGTQWADVTLSQVRRAITAAKAAAPQLDAESQQLTLFGWFLGQWCGSHAFE